MSKVTYREMERDRDHWRERAMAAEEEIDQALAERDAMEQELLEANIELSDLSFRIGGAGEVTDLLGRAFCTVFVVAAVATEVTLLAAMGVLTYDDLEGIRDAYK